VKSTVVKGLYGQEALRLSVAALPVGGRANAEAEHYLAALIDVKKSRVAVVKGLRARTRLSSWEG